MKTYRLLLFAAATINTFSISGCAFINEEIDLNYHPSLGGLALKGSNKVNIHVEVRDQRPDTTKVSTKKNSYGVEAASITLTRSPALLVRQAMETELQARGFQLADTSAQLNITADLNQFYNDIQTDYFGDAIADFDLSVAVKSQHGEDLFSKHIVAQATEPNTQFFAADNAKFALEQAEEKAMRTLFQDQHFIAALLAPSTCKPLLLHTQTSKAIITVSGELARGF